MGPDIVLFEKAIASLNSILKQTGLQLINENNDKNFITRLRHRFYFCFVLIFIYPSIIAECAWLINAIMSGKPLVEVTYPAPSVAHCALCSVKSYFFLKNEPHVNKLVSILQTLQSITGSGKSRNEVIIKVLQRTSFLARIASVLYWLNIIAISGFGILPFVIMGKTYAETQNIELMLPFSILYPFDVTNKYIWPFMYIHQMFTAKYIVLLVLGPDCFYYASCTFIEVQFLYLHYDLKRIIYGKINSSNFRAEFTGCMQRHKELIRCVNLMEIIYCKSTLLNVTSSSILICLTGFNLTAIPSWPLMMPFIAFVLLALGQIYIFCYFGDTIMSSSLAISDAVYKCQWYNADMQVKKDLLFVLTRAQKPCKLTAYGFSDINLRTFMSILSTSWSYFALLSTVNRSGISSE